MEGRRAAGGQAGAGGGEAGPALTDARRGGDGHAVVVSAGAHGGLQAVEVAFLVRAREAHEGVGCGRRDRMQGAPQGTAGGGAGGGTPGVGRGLRVAQNGSLGGSLEGPLGTAGEGSRRGTEAGGPHLAPPPAGPPAARAGRPSSRLGQAPLHVSHDQNTPASETRLEGGLGSQRHKEPGNPACGGVGCSFWKWGKNVGSSRSPCPHSVRTLLAEAPPPSLCRAELKGGGGWWAQVLLRWRVSPWGLPCAL